MNNSEKYKRTFSAIHPSADYMEAIVKTEGKKMESKKRYSMPKILAACLAAVLLLAGVTAGAYAADVGGIQKGADMDSGRIDRRCFHGNN